MASARFPTRIPLVLLGITLLAGGASGSAFQPGTVELRTDILFDHDSREFEGEKVVTVTDGEATLRLGYFFTSMIEVAGGVLYGYDKTDPETAEEVKDSYYGVRGDVILNLPTDGPIVPFVAGGVGFVAYGNEDIYGDESSLIFPVIAGGIRVLMGNSASLNLTASYRKTSNFGGMKDFDSSTFRIGVGVSAFPRRP